MIRIKRNAFHTTRGTERVIRVPYGIPYIPTRRIVPLPKMKTKERDTYDCIAFFFIAIPFRIPGNLMPKVPDAQNAHRNEIDTPELEHRSTDPVCTLHARMKQSEHRQQETADGKNPVDQ